MTQNISAVAIVRYQPIRSTLISFSKALCDTFSSLPGPLAYFKIILQDGKSYVFPWNKDCHAALAEELSVGMDPLTAQSLHLSEASVVDVELVKYPEAMPVAFHAYLKPQGHGDWELFNKHAMEIEYGFLKQIKVLKSLQPVVYWIESCGMPIRFAVEKLASEAKQPLEYGRLLLHCTQLYVEPFPELRLSGGSCRISTRNRDSQLFAWQVGLAPQAAHRLGLKHHEWVLLERQKVCHATADLPGLDEASIDSPTHLARFPFCFRRPLVASLPVQVVVLAFHESTNASLNLLPERENEHEAVLVVSDSIRAAMGVCHCELASWRAIDVSSLTEVRDVELTVLDTSGGNGSLGELTDLARVLSEKACFLLSNQLQGCFASLAAMSFVLKVQVQQRGSGAAETFDSTLYKIPWQQILDRLLKSQCPIQPWSVFAQRPRKDPSALWHSPLVTAIVAYLSHDGVERELPQLPGAIAMLSGPSGKSTTLHQIGRRMAHERHYYVEYFECRMLCKLFGPKETLAMLSKSIVHCAHMVTEHFGRSLFLIDDLDALFSGPIEDKPANYHEDGMVLMLDRLSKTFRTSVVFTCQSRTSLHPRFTEASFLEEEWLVRPLSTAEAKGLLAMKRVSFGAGVDRQLPSLLQGLFPQEIEHFLSTQLVDLRKPSVEAVTASVAAYRHQLKASCRSHQSEQAMSGPWLPWNELLGLAEAKAAIDLLFVRAFRYPTLYEQVPMRLPCGILLYGYPGCGKTFVASCLSHHLAESNLASFLYVKGPELLGKYVGASEQSVRNVFERAKALRPCVLFFDEFESLVPVRQVALRATKFLTELDGVEGLAGVYVLAATSRPDLIDPALLRPGRIDKHLMVGLPDATERAALFSQLAREYRMVESLPVDLLQEHTKGYSFADLTAILSSAQSLAVAESLEDLELGAPREPGLQACMSLAHVWQALKASRPSLSSKELAYFDAVFDVFEGKRKIVPDQRLSYA